MVPAPPIHHILGSGPCFINPSSSLFKKDPLAIYRRDVTNGNGVSSDARLLTLHVGCVCARGISTRFCYYCKRQAS